MEEIINTHKIWWGILKGRDNSEDQGVDEKIILE
jgi:hypothetical protein